MTIMKPYAQQKSNRTEILGVVTRNGSLDCFPGHSDPEVTRILILHPSQCGRSRIAMRRTCCQELPNGTPEEVVNSPTPRSE